MAYNALSGTVVANKTVVFKDNNVDGESEFNNMVMGEFHGDGTHITNVARVVANDINDYVVTLGNQEQSLVGEPNLRFNGNRLYVNAPVTASALQLTNIQNGSASISSYLAIDSNNNVVLTSSVEGSSGEATAQGPVHSLQFHTGSGGISGSGGLIYDPSNSSLYLAGLLTASSLQLTGVVNITNVESSSVLTIDQSGNIYKSLPPANGPQYSIQFEDNSNTLTGSNKLIFNPTNDQLTLSGNLVISGNITAHTFDIIHTDIIEVDASGSTKFGDSNDDTHIRTGSFSVMSSSTEQFDVDIINKVTSINTGMVFNRVSTTSDYTVQKSNYIIGVDSTSNPVIVSLPDASTLSDGQAFVVKDEGGSAFSNNITISASGSQKINNSNTAILEVPYSSIRLYCNGSNKFFIF